MWKWIIVFLAIMLLDMLWAFYVDAIAKYHPYIAAFTAGALYIFSAIGVLAYTEDRIFLIPAVVGAMVGTFIAVKYKSIKHKKLEKK